MEYGTESHSDHSYIMNLQSPYEKISHMTTPTEEKSTLWGSYLTKAPDIRCNREFAVQYCFRSRPMRFSCTFMIDISVPFDRNYSFWTTIIVVVIWDGSGHTKISNLHCQVRKWFHKHISASKISATFRTKEHCKIPVNNIIFSQVSHSITSTQYTWKYLLIQ